MIIPELPTHTVSPCDTRFCMFSHALTPHIQFLTPKKISDFGPRGVRSFSNSQRVAGAKERICNPIRCIDILFTGTAQCSESPIFRNLNIPKNSPPGEILKYFKWHKTHTVFSLRSGAETLTGLSRI